MSPYRASITGRSVVEASRGPIALVRLDYWVTPIYALGVTWNFGGPSHTLQRRQFDCAHNAYKVLKTSWSATNVSDSSRVWMSYPRPWTRPTPGTSDWRILDYVCAIADSHFRRDQGRPTARRSSGEDRRSSGILPHEAGIDPIWAPVTSLLPLPTPVWRHRRGYAFQPALAAARDRV